MGRLIEEVTLIPRRAPRQTPSPIDRILASLPEHEREVVIEAIADPSVSPSQLSVALRRAGHPVSAAAITQYREEVART